MRELLATIVVTGMVMTSFLLLNIVGEIHGYITPTSYVNCQNGWPLVFMTRDKIHADGPGTDGLVAERLAFSRAGLRTFYPIHLIGNVAFGIVVAIATATILSRNNGRLACRLRQFRLSTLLIAVTLFGAFFALERLEVVQWRTLLFAPVWFGVFCIPACLVQLWRMTMSGRCCSGPANLQ